MTFEKYLSSVNAQDVSPVTKALMMKAFEAGQRAAQQPACVSQPVKSDSQAALSAESERQAPEAALLEAFVAGRRAAQSDSAELAAALKAMIEQAQRVSVCGNFSSDVVLRAIDALAAYRQQGGES